MGRAKRVVEPGGPGGYNNPYQHIKKGKTLCQVVEYHVRVKCREDLQELLQ